MKLGAIFKLNSPSTQCFSMQQKDPSTIAFTYHAGFFSFVLLLWHVCKMLMMITSSFMTLGTWVMYFMATWKLNNSESSNFPPNAKSFIVAVLELSQGIKGHPGRRNVCFNPPPSASAWSWATCLVAACHPQRATEALVAAQSRPKKHQMTAAQWAADQSCPKSRPRCQLLDKKQTKAIWIERRGRRQLSLASDRKSKPKPFVQCQVRRLKTKSMQGSSCGERF